jgi:hypothetical protein
LELVVVAAETEEQEVQVDLVEQEEEVQVSLQRIQQVQQVVVQQQVVQEQVEEDRLLMHVQHQVMVVLELLLSVTNFNSYE